MKPTAWYDPTNGAVSTDKDSPLFTPLGQLLPLYTQRTEPPAWFPAVENILNEYGLQAIDFVADFKAAYREATQPEHEPVDYDKLADLGWQAIECGICGGGAMGYPQRTWVGLTQDERINIAYKANGNEVVAVELTEAELRSKNEH